MVSPRGQRKPKKRSLGTQIFKLPSARGMVRADKRKIRKQNKERGYKTHFFKTLSRTICGMGNRLIQFTITPLKKK